MSADLTPPAAGGRRRGLGRGLSALFGEDGEDEADLDRARASRTLPIEFLRPGRFQPRRGFNEDELDSLVESIRTKGVLQPILVRRHPEAADVYEIIAGERRWRAAQRAQLHQVPVIVRDVSDRDALEVALVENIQRQDLTPLEEAEGYQRLIREFAHTQEDLGRSLGRSRSHVANMLRLLTLPESVKDLLQAGTLSAGHARAMVNAEDPADLARQVVERGLNVRQTERLAARRKRGPGTPRPAAVKDADTLALERDLSNLLGLKVTITFRAERGGKLLIHYQTLEQLDDILQRLSSKSDGPVGPHL
jgi:ParB family chromosome partitioning protein